MKPSRLAATLSLAAVVLASCSGGSSGSPVGGDDDDATHKLGNGHYAFVIDEVPADTCWAPPKTNPELPITMTATFTVVGSEVTVVTDDTGYGSQTLELTKNGNDLTGGGAGDADLSGQGIACVLHITGAFDGVMTGEDRFDAVITLDISQAGGDCSLLVGTFLADQLDQLPCHLELAGSGQKG